MNEFIEIAPTRSGLLLSILSKPSPMGVAGATKSRDVLIWKGGASIRSAMLSVTMTLRHMRWKPSCEEVEGCESGPFISSACFAFNLSNDMSV